MSCTARDTSSRRRWPIDGVDGHPEVETALVELYRETGERRCLDLAGYFVDRFGHGLLGGGAYSQDRVPLRKATTVEGHAVRRLYPLAAAADLAAETGDVELRTSTERLWQAMTATKTHLTGGLGAHHQREDFGDPFELPTERAYCETCAAIASVRWSWRMALLTGETRYSDLIERTLYNGFLAGAPVAVRTATEYPWQGTVRLTVEETPSDRPWTLSLRVPQWCRRFQVRCGDRTYDQADAPVTDGWLRLARIWAVGDEVVLELDLEPRLTVADPCVDAVRGCVAIERGPLVYCLEQVDHPGGGLDDIVIDTARPLTVKHRPDLLGGVTTVVATGARRRIPDEPWWPYASLDTAVPVPDGDPVELTAIPYYVWANREDGSMRVWLPTS
ncbi:glycoside hydrolase family 127 protein [Streptomyces ipomoeae]|nr:beta-L-arabinofuranosidase domain-containing protein [Streptomyces ipomoeae]MDX2840068.1 glycoside hydrolase family 127 protein [Streptomyces ipomoeae]